MWFPLIAHPIIIMVLLSKLCSPVRPDVSLGRGLFRQSITMKTCPRSYLDIPAYPVLAIFRSWQNTWVGLLGSWKGCITKQLRTCVLQLYFVRHISYLATKRENIYGISMYENHSFIHGQTYKCKLISASCLHPMCTVNSSVLFYM